MLFERTHLLRHEFVLHGVHSHIYNETLVCVQKRCQRIHGTLSNWVEAQVNDLKLTETSELIEELNSSLVGDPTLLKSKFLELVTKGGSGCYHLSTVIFDEGVTHIDGELVILHAFFEVGFNLSQELWVQLVGCWVTFSHHVLWVFDCCSTVVIIPWLLLLHVSLHVSIIHMTWELLLLLLEAWLLHH